MRLGSASRIGAQMIGAAASLALAACSSGNRPLEDKEQIVAAALKLTASDGKPVCVDDHTQEKALSIFKEMILAPRPSREPLHWYPPRPLRPETRLTAKDLRQSELRRDGPDIKITEPGARRDPLPNLDQVTLDNAARQLMGPVTRGEPVSISRYWTPAGVTARWWPLNRIRKDCWPQYEISDPVRGRDIAFVTVRAEHWGTLYAVRPTPGGWAVVAEWTRWLY